MTDERKGVFIKHLVLTLLILVLASAFRQPRALAQTSSPSASYAAEWNMAEGPSGTDLNVAAYVYAYGSAGYFVASDKHSQACQGYWSYFTDPAVVSLPVPASVTSQSCQLQARWNLVGNSFPRVANLPPGVTGYWWTPDRDAYDVVTTIPVGGAVRINATSLFSLNLQYVPSQAPAPALLVVDETIPSGPDQLHVGDDIKVITPSISHFSAQSDAKLLHLESAGVSGSLSWVGDPSCALSLVDQFWIYGPVAPDTADITLTSGCNQGTVCSGPSTIIEVNIVP